MKLIPVNGRMSDLFVCCCQPPPQITISFVPPQKCHLSNQYMKVAVTFCSSQTVQLLVDESVPLQLTAGLVGEMIPLGGMLKRFIQRL